MLAAERARTRLSLPNVLPFSSERQSRFRAYHGREEPRTRARDVAALSTIKRTTQAFTGGVRLLQRSVRRSVMLVSAKDPQGFRRARTSEA
jgi:hypothetical protein